MAQLMPLTGKFTFKCDTGETSGGKAVYRNIGISGINGTQTAAKLAASTAIISGLLSMTVERAALVRTDLVLD